MDTLVFSNTFLGFGLDSAAELPSSSQSYNFIEQLGEEGEEGSISPEPNAVPETVVDVALSTDPEGTFSNGHEFALVRRRYNPQPNSLTWKDSKE